MITKDTTVKELIEYIKLSSIKKITFSDFDSFGVTILITDDNNSHCARRIPYSELNATNFDTVALHWEYLIQMMVDYNRGKKDE